jgi:DNA gyrase/topoisomerase IV subunit A
MIQHTMTLFVRELPTNVTPTFLLQTVKMRVRTQAIPIFLDIGDKKNTLGLIIIIELNNTKLELSLETNMYRQYARMGTRLLRQAVLSKIARKRARHLKSSAQMVTEGCGILKINN